MKSDGKLNGSYYGDKESERFRMMAETGIYKSLYSIFDYFSLSHLKDELKAEEAKGLEAFKALFKKLTSGTNGLRRMCPECFDSEFNAKILMINKLVSKLGE